MIQQTQGTRQVGQRPAVLPQPHLSSGPSARCAYPGLRAHEGGARRVVGVVELEDLRVWRDGQAREGQRLRLLRLVRVLRALEDLEVAEEIAAVGVLGQHALDRLLDDALRNA